MKTVAALLLDARRPGEAQYRIVSRHKDGDNWKEMWTRLFERQ